LGALRTIDVADPSYLGGAMTTRRTETVAGVPGLYVLRGKRKNTYFVAGDNYLDRLTTTILSG
jgi:hypothetical protein